VPFVFYAALIAICLVAAARVALTYPIFGQTFDEPAHIACGLEIVSSGRYTLEPQHPPLARIATGIGLRVAGLTLPPAGTIWQRGNEILYSAGRYVSNLTHARAGTLAFLILAIVTTWAWARQLFDDRIAIAAAALLSITPAILGHSGLATTDMAVAATTLLALYRTWRWLEQPSILNAIWCGVAIALAFTSKFSALLFVPAGIIALFIVRRGQARAPVLHVLVIVLTAILVTWGVYAFSLDTWREIVTGVKWSISHERGGHPAYLLGRNSPDGWWYFFVVAFLVKTPIALIVLMLIGAIDRRTRLPLGIAVAFFIVTMPVQVAIGLRHLLPVYPFVCMVAAAGLFRWRPLAIALAGWLLIATTLAHPDYFAYFNEATFGHADYFLVDSDLDWGQDILRLTRVVDARTEPLTIAYFGTADLRRHNLPPFHTLRAGEEPRGWIALSVTILRKGKPPGRFQFLEGVPYTMIGTSIRLYYRPDASRPRNRRPIS
jgi:hypothetical protein